MTAAAPLTTYKFSSMVETSLLAIVEEPIQIISCWKSVHQGDAIDAVTICFDTKEQTSLQHVNVVLLTSPSGSLRKETAS